MLQAHRGVGWNCTGLGCPYLKSHPISVSGWGYGLLALLESEERVPKLVHTPVSVPSPEVEILHGYCEASL